jgi:hypothetical protein
MTDILTAASTVAVTPIIPAQHTPTERLANPRRTMMAHDGSPRRGLHMIGAEAADTCVDGVCAVPDQG